LERFMSDDIPKNLHAINVRDADPQAEGEVMEGMPHGREIGMRLHSSADGNAVLSVPYDERLVGDPETGILHGGVMTVLLDTASGSAVMSKQTKMSAIATLDLRIDYMRPATPGKAVFAAAECYRLTRSVGFTRAVAYHDDPDDPIASAAGAFMLGTKEGSRK
jgi:uncharacterized protein (TIGR00369 family)